MDQQSSSSNSSKFNQMGSNPPNGSQNVPSRGQSQDYGGQNQQRGRGQSQDDGSQNQQRGRGQSQDDGSQNQQRARGQSQDYGGQNQQKARDQSEDYGGQNLQKGRGQSQDDGSGKDPSNLRNEGSYTVLSQAKPKNADTRLDIVRQVRLEANFCSNKEQQKEDSFTSKRQQNMDKKVIDPVAEFLKESKDHQVCFMGSFVVPKGHSQSQKPWTFELYMIRSHGGNDIDFKIISRNGDSDLAKTFTFGEMDLEFLSISDEKPVFQRKLVLDLINGPSGSSGGCSRSLSSQEYQSRAAGVGIGNSRTNPPLLEKFCHVSTFILTSYDLKKCLQICPQGNCTEASSKIAIEARIQLSLYSESSVDTISLPPINPVFGQILSHIFSECLISDLIIKTSNGDQYKVHKCILAAQSDVFQRLFSKHDGHLDLEDSEQVHEQKGFENSAEISKNKAENHHQNPPSTTMEDKSQAIEILNYPPEAVRLFLRFFYFNDCTEIISADETIVLDVFRLAWRYNFISLMEMAASNAGQIQDLGIALKLFVNGCQLDLEPLKNQAVQIIKEHGADLKSSKEFQDFVKFYQKEDSDILLELFVRLANSS